MKQGSGMGEAGISQDKQRGATLVEFAIVAPLLFLLLFGLIEFGRAIATYTDVATAAREGARYGTTVGDSPSSPGIPRYLDCSGIKDAALGKSVVADLDHLDITVEYDNGPGTLVDADCDGLVAAPTEALVGSGDRIVVKVASTFSSPIPLISSVVGTLQVTSEQARTIFRGVING